MAELLRRHWGTALLAGRVLASPDLARDAVQEAAIAAMTDLERLRSPERFGAWFCGIALNVSRRWLRQLQSEVPGLRSDLASVSSDPAEAAEIADTAARVRDAIAALADGQQHAVWLFYLRGLSRCQFPESSALMSEVLCTAEGSAAAKAEPRHGSCHIGGLSVTKSLLESWPRRDCDS